MVASRAGAPASPSGPRRARAPNHRRCSRYARRDSAARSENAIGAYVPAARAARAAEAAASARRRRPRRMPRASSCSIATRVRREKTPTPRASRDTMCGSAEPFLPVFLLLLFFRQRAFRARAASRRTRRATSPARPPLQARRPSAGTATRRPPRRPPPPRPAAPAAARRPRRRRRRPPEAGATPERGQVLAGRARLAELAPQEREGLRARVAIPFVAGFGFGFASPVRVVPRRSPRDGRRVSDHPATKVRVRALPRRRKHARHQAGERRRVIHAPQV